MRTSSRLMFSFAASALLAIAIACAAAPASPGSGDRSPVSASPTPGPSTDPEFVEKLAPIESVDVRVAESFPPQYFLLVKSGLPNGCAKFNDYELTREGNEVNVKVTNLEIAPGQPVSCTMIYGIVETNIALGSDFNPGTTYNVAVNDFVTTFTTESSTTAGSDGPKVSEPTATPSATGMVEVLAPIESVKVQIAESFPPQYFLLVKSGLPNGCAKFNDYELTREGDTIHVRVTNLVPADPNVMCTQVYSTVESSIPLGSDFTPGVKYTVVVNEVTETFVAQGMSEPSQPRLDSPFRVELGQTASIESEGLRIEFMDVTADSRCPRDVLCVWAGVAIVLVGVTRDGQDLGQRELTLEGGQEESESERVGEYLVKLTALEPYPKSDVQIDKSDYVATLVVSSVALKDDAY